MITNLPDGQWRMAGTVLTLPGVAWAELVAEAFDVVWIDLEHGALDRAAAQEMLIGAQASGAAAFVRIPGVVGHEQLAGAMLDAGADGIVAPNVHTREEAERLARALRHPPEGNRGFGPRRSGLRRRRRGGPSPSQAKLWAQIESQAGAGAAAEIARVDGVGALVVGISDLSGDIGGVFDSGRSALVDAIRAVKQAAQDAGIWFGIAGPLLERDADLGQLVAEADVVIHSTDARLCAAAFDQAGDQLRAPGAGRPVRLV